MGLVGPAPGTVRGVVRVFASSSSAQTIAAPEASQPVKGHGSKQPLESASIPGDLVIGTHQVLTAPDVLDRIKALTGLRCTHGGWGSERLHRIHCTERGEPTARSVLEAAILTLTSAEAFRFVELNFVAQPTITPNDPMYDKQWHYRAMNLHLAWNITRGDPSVVVGVLDTGSSSNADLAANTLPGIDLISDPMMAADGDGRDLDPTDVMGPVPPQQRGSSWHGTHVAGTIAAVTDNRLGVVGGAPNVRVLHVRVLGRGGGTSFDIATGITWAVGEAVPGLPRNQNPVQVINMSLAGTGTGSQTYGTAIASAAAAEAIVVVAAGNDDADTATVQPCNAAGVICVGALDLRGRATGSTNYGREVTISAPGGAVDRDDDGNGEPDGVLSTVGDGRYLYLEGTSMATPHVAALVALMKSQNRTLTHAQVVATLRANVSPIPNCPMACGAGAVDALRVMQTIAPRTTRPGRLTSSADALVFNEATRTNTLRLMNTGDAPIGVRLLANHALISNFSWSADTVPLPLAAGRSIDITIEYKGTITSDADVNARFVVEGSGAETPIAFRLRKPRLPPRTVVVARVLADDTLEPVSQANVAADGSYRVEAPAGQYLIMALVDENGDGTLATEEAWGVYPNKQMPRLVEVMSGRFTDEVDFSTSR